MHLESKLYRCKQLADGPVRLFERLNKPLGHVQYLVCLGDADPIRDAASPRVQAFDSLASAQHAVSHALARLQKTTAP